MNLRYSLRIINRNRVYSAINLLGLSLGITVFTLIILFVRYEFGYDRYHTNYNKIYRIVTDGGGEYQGTTKSAVIASPFMDAIKETVKETEFITRIGWRTNVLLVTNGKSFFEPDYHYADPDFFRIFSLDVIAGQRERLLTDPSNVVLSESVATRLYGSADNAIGKSLSAERQGPMGDYVVQAVVRDMPHQSHFRVNILFPFEGLVKTVQETDLTAWNNNNYWIYFTLQPGADVATAGKQLTKYAQPKLGYDNPPSWYFQPLPDIYLGEKINFDLGVTGNKDQLYIFLCIGMLVLFIACINYVNMATARASSRAKEIGVRKVNGALRLDLVAQFMTEAFLSVVAAAVVAGVAIAMLLPVYNEFLGKHIVFDLPLLPIAALIVAVGFVSGAYPALLFSSFKPIHTLKGKFSKSHNPGLRNALVVFQFVVSGTLVFCTLIVWKQMEFVKNKDLGFNRDHIVIVRMRDEQLAAKSEEIRQMLLRNPSIQKVSASLRPATGVGSHQGRIWQRKNGEEQRVSIYINQVDPYFLDLYQIPLVAGQNLSYNSWTKDIVVNETLVRELGFTNEEILGRQFIARDTARVIGVVKDFHYMDFKLKIEPMEFRWKGWGSPQFLSVKIDQHADITSVLGHIRGSIESISEKYPFEYSFYDEVYSKTFIAEAKTSKLMTLFSTVAIIIAVLGLYGLVLHMVNQRMKEIGIRKTLGAGSWSIVQLLSGKFGLLIVTGYAIACVIGYYGVQRWLEAFAYRISPTATDFVITLVTIALIAGIAVSSRILVALRINPAVVLKYE